MKELSSSEIPGPSDKAGRFNFGWDLAKRGEEYPDEDWWAEHTTCNVYDSEEAQRTMWTDDVCRGLVPRHPRGDHTRRQGGGGEELMDDAKLPDFQTLEEMKCPACGYTFDCEDTPQIVSFWGENRHEWACSECSIEFEIEEHVSRHFTFHAKAAESQGDGA